MHNRWRHTHIAIHQEYISRLTVRGRHVKIIVQSASPACSGCAGPPHDVRRMCQAWKRSRYKCQKLNHFANACNANSQQTHLVENDTHSQSSGKLCEDTYTLVLYHRSATHTIPPYICNVQGQRHIPGNRYGIFGFAYIGG